MRTLGALIVMFSMATLSYFFFVTYTSVTMTAVAWLLVAATLAGFVLTLQALLEDISDPLG